MGVVGAGAFGANHLRVLSSLEGSALAGVYDTDPARADAAAHQYGCRAYGAVAALAEVADAAVVATPTSTHEPVAGELLDAGVDVLVEKPIAGTADAARRLIATARSRDRILQVGHLERFNPAVQALQRVLDVPLFFEIHRLSLFTARSLDIDVVLDLMIHDLDIVLALTRAEPEEVRAAGISILSGKIDIANVRLAFPNGCVANLTASRVSVERIRKLRVFQPNEYISVDYQRQDGTRVRVREGGGDGISVDLPGQGPRHIDYEPLPVEKAEPLRLELASFLDCVRTRRAPVVGGDDALRALELAHTVLAKIEEHAQVVARTLAADAETSSRP